jgi:FlaA1/EpsC-like NDP-sugar epimerase
MKIEYLTCSLMLALILLLNNFRGELFVKAEPYWWCQASVLLLGLYEIAAVFIVNKKYKSVSPRQSINLFMGLKVGKILLSVFFVMLYAFMVKMEMRRVIIIFVTLYLIFLAFDTIYLVCCEKNRVIKDEK